MASTIHERTSGRVLVPVLQRQAIRGWPRYEKGGHAGYTPLHDALTVRHPTDAHFAAYSVPSLRRRLTLEALRRAELPDGVPMVAAVFDVDCREAHVAGVPLAADTWWLGELAKLDGLRARHPGAFIYRTRGGYRIVYGLEAPVVLRDASDGAKWSSRYAQWVAYLRRAFSIDADAACADWPRLFRLPHATRVEGGGSEERETIGDPSQIGPWTCEPTAEDVAAAEGMRPKTRGREVRRPRPCRVSAEVPIGSGVLFHAFEARGEIGTAVEAGKWKAACPWESEHSKGERFDGSTVLYAPSAGGELGWLHCSHAHCTGRDMRDVLAHFTDDELARAREAAGIPLRGPSTSPPVTVVGERPQITVTTEERDVDDQAIDALAQLGGVYQRGGTLVDVVDATRTGGAPRIRELPLPRLRELLSEAAEWMVERFNKDAREHELSPTHPPEWVVRAVHARGTWKAIPELTGVTESPALRPDGSILQTPGYDAATGLLYLPNADYAPVPDAPTQEDAAHALLALCEPFSDFPFADEPHRSAAIAAVLTPFARAAFDGPSPLIGITATTPGDGKSLCADTIVILATGRTAAKMPHTPDEEEMRKAITALAMEGCTMAVIDNVVHPLGSPALDNALTSTVWKDRLLGRTAMVTLPLLMMWMATGNNLTYVGDAFRRVLPIELASNLENPENRSGFKHADLRAYVWAERPRLAVAALTVLRAYVVANMPDQDLPRWGSFEGWSRLIPHALVWAGLPDPMAARGGPAAIVDARKGALLALLSAWPKLGGGQPITTAAALQRIYPLGAHESAPEYILELREVLESAIPSHGRGLPDARRLGKLLQGYRGRVCGSQMFESSPYQGTMRWSVVNLTRRTLEPQVHADNQNGTRECA
jgi:hypothetical protein